MTWTDLIKGTFRAPEQVYRQVLDMRLPRATPWQALALTVILSAIFSAGSLMLVPVDLPPFMAFMRNPVENLFVQALFNLLFVLILSGYLRFFGGQQTASDIALAIAWVQAMMILLLILQLLVPPLAGLIGLIGFVFYFWLLARFSAEAAGFTQPFGAFMLIFAALFTAALATSFAMLSLGIVRPEDLMNV